MKNISVGDKPTPHNPFFRRLASSFVAIVFAAPFLILAPVSAAGFCQQVAMPAYFYPNPPAVWDQATAASPTLSIMIADPATGPGSSKDANYAASIVAAKAKSIKIMGYVDTNYSIRSADAVKADINQWKTLYKVTDIFFDRATTNTSQLGYYQELINYVHSTEGSIAMIGPGTVPDEGYVKAADITVMFENQQSIFSNFKMPDWASKYPSTKFAQLVYNVPDSPTMLADLKASRDNGIGYIYITNDIMPNPWDQLPSYWDDEVSQINRDCSGSNVSNTAPATIGGTNSTHINRPFTKHQNKVVLYGAAAYVLLCAAELAVYMYTKKHRLRVKLFVPEPDK